MSCLSRCCRPFLTALLLAAAGTGCLDLSEEGKVFACPDCTDAGSGPGPSVCACEVPAARCEGDLRLSASSSRCLEDGGCEAQWVETPCPRGCAEGRCIGEPCLGTVCAQPPASRCEGPTALRVFTTPGACQAGGCLYASAEVSCDCEAGRCKQNPCLGVTCAAPPGASCAGGGLRTYQSPGTCDAATGRCSYALAQLACGPSGCVDGRCADDACTGVVCNQPPAATCVNATTVQSSKSPGTCSPTSGACSYATQLTPCPAGQQCSQGACVPASASCNASNCAGCCEGSACVLPANQSGARCGAAGLACGACGADAPSCSAGACVNRCEGVTCNQPPAATCADATTRTVWSGGTCDRATGACSYANAQVTCGPGNTCAGGACSCVSESEASLCARLGKSCGAVASNDNCGVPRTVQCGSCAAGQSCVNAVCACASESDAAFCARLSKSCGPVSGTDNCGAPRVANCGACAAGLTCSPSNACTCAASESDAAFCARLSKSCGTVSGTDTCGAPRVANCGSCPSGESCSASNVCACVPESDAAACARLGAQCGPLQAVDNCGAPRSLSCGGCASPNTCDASNRCSCASESNAAFCARLSKNCGTVSGTDSCNLPRTVSCGSCTSPQSCGGAGVPNVCGASSRLVFSTSWQTLPNTGAQTVEFLCAGTVTTSAAGGTRCTASGGDSVRFRINGSTYDFYPGCDGNRPSNCMTSITPSGATYDSWGLLSAGKLLCDAMGWPFSSALSDNNPGTVSRPVAVVQTAPAVIGTAPDLKNYATYVGCEP